MSAPRLALALLAGCLLSLAAASPAAAVPAPAPAWSIESLAAPTDFTTAANALPEGGAGVCATSSGLLAQQCDVYYVTATDTGAKAMASGQKVVLEDTLPPGLGVRHVSLFWPGIEAVANHSEQENLNPVKAPRCTVAVPKVTCTLPSSFFSGLAHTIQPDDMLIMEIAVSVNEPASAGLLENQVKVEGGALEAGGTTPISAHASAINTLEEGTPPFGPALFSAPALAPNGSGAPETPALQAGSHPYELPTHIDFTTSVREESSGVVMDQSVQDPRDVLVDLPPGMAGSALSTPAKCSFAQLVSHGNEATNLTTGCPEESRIGFLRTYPISLGPAVKSPLYNMEPQRGAVAELGYVDLLHGTHVLKVSLVPSPRGYVLRTSSTEIPQAMLTRIIADVYGDPAARDGSVVGTHVPTLTAPANCTGEPLLTQIHMDSWQHPGTYNPDGSPNLAEPNWVTKTYEAPPVGGCDKLAGLFAPTLEAHPTTTQADKPTGLEVTLKVPQTEGIGTLGTPPLRKAVVTLPEGMSVNPSSANGLEGCSLAQLGISASGQPNAEPVRCPDASKLGKVELRTPALPGTLEGQIYVAKQSENPFNSLLALYIVVDDPTTGVLVKIPAEVKADPNTGRLTTIVDNSPQFPFSELTTKFFGGQKAALRTPAVCGSYEVTSELTPWSAPQSGEPAKPAGSFEISGGCAPSAAQEPNAPSFSAGTVEPLAGAYSPFVMKLRREDASQELKGLNVTLPEGLIAKLAGVGECSEAQIAQAKGREQEGGGQEELANPSCPASSEVGTVTVGAGAGLTPYYTTGHAYLAGPYRGAPLSLVVITPAVAGPYDLGAVLVRAPLRLDPETAQVSAATSLPSILHGIPLDLRSISLQMSRPQFTLNPTNCERKAVTGEALTTQGQVANLSDPFQVGGCKSLGFKPKLAISLKGGTKRAGHPALKAVLTMKPGEANIAKAQVTLPHAEFLDQGHIQNVCTRTQFAAAGCPPSSVLGFARAETPLLDQSLEGPVYLMSGFGHKLPDVAADLNGQIRVLLHGKVDTGKGGGIRNTFEVVPDAPVSRFTLSLKGGSRGLIVNSESLCAKVQKAIADFTGQNGKVSNTEPVLKVKCKKKRGGKGHKKHRRHR